MDVLIASSYNETDVTETDESLKVSDEVVCDILLVRSEDSESAEEMKELMEKEKEIEAEFLEITHVEDPIIIESEKVDDSFETDLEKGEFKRMDSDLSVFDDEDDNLELELKEKIVEHEFVDILQHDPGGSDSDTPVTNFIQIVLHLTIDMRYKSSRLLWLTKGKVYSLEITSLIRTQ